jgi:hypothetical protein
MRRLPLLTGYTLSSAELRRRESARAVQERFAAYTEVADSIVNRGGFGDRFGTMAIARILIGAIDEARLSHGEGSKQHLTAQAELVSARGGVER